MPLAILDNHVELVRGQHKVQVRSARIEVSAFQGQFDLSRQDMQATALVEAVCRRGECPLLARRGEPWTLSGYAAGLPRLSLQVLPVEVKEVLPLGDDRWRRVYVVDCVIVSRPVLDDPYGLFPGSIREGEIDLGQLVRLLSEGVRGWRRRASPRRVASACRADDPVGGAAAPEGLGQEKHAGRPAKRWRSTPRGPPGGEQRALLPGRELVCAGESSPC